MLTIEGIETAIANLGLTKETSPKYRLLQAIRRLYESQDSIEQLPPPDPDELIKEVWQLDGDKEALKKKRRNLNTLRSALNSDFMRLYRNGKNPEGVMIGPQFLFVMSEEAKDNILDQIGNQISSGGKLSLSQITEVLGLINQFLSDNGLQGSGQEEVENLKKVVEGLSKGVGIGTGGGEAGTGAVGGEEGQELAAEEVEVVEEPVEELDPEEEIVEAPEDEALGPDGQSAEPEGRKETYPPGEEFGERATEPEEAAFAVREPEEDKEGSSGGGLGDEAPSRDHEGGQALETAPEGESPEEGGAAEDPGGFSGEGGTGADAEEAEFVEEAVEDDEPEISEEDLDEETAVEPLRQGGEGELSEPQEVVDDNILTSEEETVDDATVDIEEILVEGTGEESPLGLGEGLGQDTEYDDPNEKARMLAEAFDGYLGAMDRYYNQYLLIPGGEYVVGSPSDPDYEEQFVSLAPFYLGKFPVTNALFEIFVEKTGYITTAEKVGYGIVYEGRYRQKVDPKTGKKKFVWHSGIRRKRVEGAFWYQPSGPGSNLHGKRNHPVVQVSLEDAMAFAAWTGKRLPTEAEWEAGSRTRKGFPFPWGEVWVDEASNVESSLIAETTPVDQYKDFANELGIADCLGNVMEWTQSTIGDSCLVKGGGWLAKKGTPLWSRAAVDPSYHSNVLGFRCVAY